MLKKLTSSLLLFACACVYASAAEDSTDKLRAADPLPFSQGWFAGAGLGANIGADGLKGDNPEFSIGLPGMHLYAGKWITPAFGLRFGIQGLHAAGFHGADGYEFLAAPVDLMVNIPSLLIPSLKKTPFDFSLYLSAVPAWGLPSGYYAFGVGGGLQASYSFNDNWAAFADARGSIIGQNITGILNQGIFATAAVSVGAQYSFSLGKKALTPEVAAQDAKASEQAAPEIPQEVPAGEPAPGIAETEGSDTCDNPVSADIKPPFPCRTANITAVIPNSMTIPCIKSLTAVAIYPPAMTYIPVRTAIPITQTV